MYKRQCIHNQHIVTSAQSNCRHNQHIVTSAQSNCIHNQHIVTSAQSNCIQHSTQTTYRFTYLSFNGRFQGQPPPHTTTVLRRFFRDHPGEAVPEENFWTLWCKINRGRHTDHPATAGRHSIRTNQCPPPPSPHIFYRPDALPAAQPTASKH